MKTILIITGILLGAVFTTSCRADVVAENEAEILELMEPPLSYMRTGRLVPPSLNGPWFRFTYQQHDDLTLNVLLNLAKTSSDENVRKLAINGLAKQKNPRLIPFWQDLLANRDNVGAPWPDHVYLNAVPGLLRINTPESTRFLRNLLSSPDTTAELLYLICVGCSRYAEGGTPVKLWRELILLTSHKSREVRFAALGALPYYLWIPNTGNALRGERLKRALAENSLMILLWAYGVLRENTSPEFLPITLDYLNDTNAYVRAYADAGLSVLLSNRNPKRFENFAKCAKALEEKRWTYQTAPLLTLQFAKILRDKRGDFEEAEKALEAAKRAYTPNDAHDMSLPNPGAAMLYQLIKVKQKRGDIEGAVGILNRLVREYPQRAWVYAGRIPPPSKVPYRSVEQLETELRSVLENAPIRIRVTPLTETPHPAQHLKFKVSLQNITDEDVTLHCTRRQEGGAPVPGYTSINVNASNRTTFRGINSLGGTVKKETIRPNESFSFVGTLRDSLPSGNHVIHFRFDVTCELENGEKWSHNVLANSVKLTIP